MNYHWSYTTPDWLEQLGKYDTASEAYWKEWDKHFGTSEDFGSCYRAVQSLSAEYFNDKSTRMAIAQLAAALGRGDIQRFDVDGLWVQRKENTNED